MKINPFEVKAMWTLTDLWQGIKPRRRSRHRQRVRRLIWGLLLSVAVIGFPLVSQALTVQEVPNPQEQYGGWVTDRANVLSEETEQALNQKISELEAQNGTEIAVVTVRDTSSEATPKAFATRLFNHWGVGKADVDNGVLWLHSVGDRRVEIETGYGIEGILPDAQVGGIIDEVIIPQFREDDFDGGTLAGVEALIAVLSEEEFQVPGNRPGNLSNSVSDRLADMDNRGDFWLAALVGWGVSALGYGTIRQRLRRPIELDPRGRSRVMGLGDYTLYKGLLVVAVIAGFTLSVGVLIPLIILDDKIAWIVIVMLLGIGVAKANVALNQFYEDSQDGQFDLAWDEIDLERLNPLVQLVIIGIALVLVLGLIVLLTARSSTPGEPTVAPLIFCSSLASFSVAWLAYDLAKTWIQKQLTMVCQTCQGKLVPVEDHRVDEKLNHPQTVAKELGSTQFTGLRCPNCCPQESQFHLRSYRLKPKKFDECPVYEEFTVTHTLETVVEPTPYKTGLKEKTYHCQVCDYSKKEEIIIARQTTSTGGVSGGGGGGFDGGGGGGGGFGGGDSGGGGAGGSY
ncbi:MAG: uncharacterized protein HLUCCO16_03255 [Phormidium sp. OSCR]|nr:MAG: uncharacterized protein HLUCCO16_03255 [Phormidium sp. OSCR]